MARVILAEVKKSFGATQAVDNFSLDVAEGEFVALLGPSGCGKTTVMRMIAGIAEPDSGEITIGGKPVVGLPPERRNVGLVFQSYALFPHMTVEGNVAFGLEMQHLPRSEINRRVTAILAIVDLTAQAKRHPRQLSGGQQQRVALARALVTEPDVLLLDEPLSNLDAKLREHLREDIRNLQRRLGITAIYVTHDQSEALALADRVVVMSGGRIVEAGSAACTLSDAQAPVYRRIPWPDQHFHGNSNQSCNTLSVGQRTDRLEGPQRANRPVRPARGYFHPSGTGWPWRGHGRNFLGCRYRAQT